MILDEYFIQPLSSNSCWSESIWSERLSHVLCSLPFHKPENCHEINFVKFSNLLLPEDGSSGGNLNVIKLVLSRRSSIFWDITLCRPLEVNRRFGGTCRLHLPGRKISQARNQHEAGSKQIHATCLMLVSCFAYTLALNMEWTYSSETSVGLQRTTRRYIPWHRDVHNHLGENLVSCAVCIPFAFGTSTFAAASSVQETRVC
jgi:hypothetical protein